MATLDPFSLTSFVPFALNIFFITKQKVSIRKTLTPIHINMFKTPLKRGKPQGGGH
jgi:hypothetical protein